MHLNLHMLVQIMIIKSTYYCPLSFHFIQECYVHVFFIEVCSKHVRFNMNPNIIKLNLASANVLKAFES